jgi:hypothetical protein
MFDQWNGGFFRPAPWDEPDRRPSRPAPPAPAPLRVDGHLLAIVRVASGIRRVGPFRSEPAPSGDGFAGYCQCGRTFTTSRRKHDDAPPPVAYIEADHARHVAEVLA